MTLQETASKNSSWADKISLTDKFLLDMIISEISAEAGCVTV